MTIKQRAILLYISQFMDAKGVPPTVRETAKRFKITSATAHEHLRKLVKLGVVSETDSKSLARKYTPADRCPICGQPIQKVRGNRRRANGGHRHTSCRRGPNSGNARRKSKQKKGT